MERARCVAMPRSLQPTRRRRVARGAGALAACAALLVLVLNWTVGRLPAEPPATGTITQVDGLRLRYLERPGTGTPVVLLHGLPGTAEDFEEVTRRLTGRRTVAVDRPGYGGSSGGYVPLDRQLHALEALLDRLRIHRAVIVGHSYGGAIALGLAQRHPGRVAGLVLVDAAAAGFRLGAAARAQALALSALGLPVVSTLAGLTFSQLVRTVAAHRGDAEAFAPSPVAGAHRRRLLAVNMTAGDVAALAGEQRAANRVIARIDGGLARVRVPTVVVHADQDRLVAPMYGRRLAAAIPRARLLRVRGGHMTPYTHPGVIAGAIAGLTGPERRNGPGASR